MQLSPQFVINVMSHIKNSQWKKLLATMELKLGSLDHQRGTWTPELMEYIY